MKPVSIVFIFMLLWFYVQSSSVSSDDQSDFVESTENDFNNTLLPINNTDVLVGEIAMLDTADDQENKTANSTNSLDDTDCPICKAEKERLEKYKTEEDYRKMRLELIKIQILAKLGLKDTPNVSIPFESIPKPLLQKDIMQKDEPERHGHGVRDDFYGRTTEVVIFAERVPNCPNNKPSTCFWFDTAKHKIDADDITSAEIWVYKLRDRWDGYNQTLALYELGDTNRISKRIRRLVEARQTSLKRGWLQFNTLLTVKRWLGKPQRNYGVIVSCKTCARESNQHPIKLDSPFQPFLVIHVGDGKTRKRRSFRDNKCTPEKTECCLEEFYVNFREIWSQPFIISPDGYMANYCKGSCRGMLGPPAYHTTVLQRAKTVSENDNISFCCYPTRLSSISVLYTANGEVIKKDLSRMRAEACGCA